MVIPLQATKKGKVDEWKLLQAEEGLAKKLKNGKISAMLSGMFHST